MGDRYDQRLVIGGPLPLYLVEGLLDTAYAEGLELMFNVGPWPENPEALQMRLGEQHIELKGHPDSKGQLWLEALDHSYCFEATEKFCRDHGLSYQRFCDAKYEYDPDIIVYRPVWPDGGTDGEREVMGSQYSDEPALKLGELKKQQAAGKTLEQVIAELETLHVAAIPPLEIVPGERPKRTRKKKEAVS